MGYAIRMAVYVLGGGALLAWIQPRHGVIEIAAVLAVIGVSAVADGLVEGTLGMNMRRAPAREKKSAVHRGGAGSGGRRSARPLFITSDLEEAQALLAQLRDRALHPLLVTRRGAREEDPVQFEVRLPEPEQNRAGPIVSRFSTRAAER